MPPRKPTRTTDGDDMPPLPANHDVAATIHLLEYARAKGFRIGPILEVGTVKMQVRDVRQEKLEGGGSQQDWPDYPAPDAGLDEPEPGTAG